MREILTISLPKEKLNLIKKITKDRNFNSVSEYVNFSIDQEQKMISEDQILEYTKQSQKEYKQSKTKRGLSSLQKIAGK